MTKLLMVMLISFVVGLSCGCVLPALAQASWTPVAPMPSVRQQHGAAELGGFIYVVGGADCAFCTLRYPPTFAYDPQMDTWVTKAPSNLSRKNVAAASLDGLVYLVGGDDDTNTFAAVEAYDPVSDSWSFKASLSNARSLFGVAAVDGRLYAIGGSTVASLTSVEAYDPSTDTWSPRSAMPTARYALAVAAVNGVIYAVGGLDPFSAGHVLATVEAYDPMSDTWSTKAPMPTARMVLAVSAVDGHLYAVGGTDGQSRSFSTVEVYDPVLDTWSSAPSMSTARASLATVAVNGVLYAIGGGTPSGIVASGESFNPSPNVPDCARAVANPNLLWPPNHKFVPIQILGVTNPGGGLVTIRVTSIFQDEPVNGSPDATGAGTSTPSVRSERDGRGDGRVYHLSFRATNASGGGCTGAVTVGVPHDQGPNGGPLDEGALYDSTLP